MIDLASESVGGEVVFCNDDFFAPVSNLLSEAVPVWREGEYTDRGKWMDGWESRRRRQPGHDWCDIALGLPGRVERIVVDTSHFTGNYPESFSLEALGDGATDDIADDAWTELVPQTGLAGDSIAEFDVADPHRVTHLRFKIYPDGGVARLRVLGTPIPAMQSVCPDRGRVDLAGLGVGGSVVEASDVHFSPPERLLRPGDGRGMWDGWETRRRRGPGHDWVVVRLGLPGTVEGLTVDTRHFKGNAPGRVSVDVSNDGGEWVEVLPNTEVRPDDVADLVPATIRRAELVRLNIHPDGGVSRFRVLGRPDTDAAAAVRTTYVNALYPRVAGSFFGAACGSKRWVAAMTAARPYPDAATVLTIANSVFDTLDRSDWLEAFAAHPRIGERGSETANREQSQVEEADEATRSELARVNTAYEERFGHTYIVKAAGRTASEMLAIAQRRLRNDPDTELEEAAEQQRLITETRLRRMLCLDTIK
jgi:allantoicase